jgi:hypothetical protein
VLGGVLIPAVCYGACQPLTSWRSCAAPHEEQAGGYAPARVVRDLPWPAGTPEQMRAELERQKATLATLEANDKKWVSHCFPSHPHISYLPPTAPGPSSGPHLSWGLAAGRAA